MKRKFRTLTHVYMQHGGLFGNGAWIDEKAESLLELVQYRRALMAELVMNDPSRIEGTVKVHQEYVGLTYRVLIGEWPVIKYAIEYESSDMGRVAYVAWTVHDDAPPAMMAPLN